MRIRGETEASDYELLWAARQAQNSQFGSRAQILRTIVKLLGERTPAWLVQEVAALPVDHAAPITGPMAEMLERAEAAP